MVKCTACRRPAVAYLRYAGHYFCKKHFLSLYWRRVKRHIYRTGMIQKGDTVGIAASGGKDSTALLYVLSKMFKGWPGVKLVAISADEGAKGYRSESVKVVGKHCKRLGIRHEIVSFKKEFGMPIDKVVRVLRRKGETKGVCSFCGVLRRYILNKAARRLGCTKLATAHNLDDEAQSILMNFMRGQTDRMARLGPVTGVSRQDGFVQRIKPLRKIPEKENALFVLLNNIEIEKGSCPYRGEAFRGDVRKLLNIMESKHAGTKFTIVETFDKLLPALKEKQKGEKPNKCGMCGELTSGHTCKVCQILEMIKSGKVVSKRKRGSKAAGR